MSKIKVACFFWDTVYITILLYWRSTFSHWALSVWFWLPATRCWVNWCWQPVTQ